MNSLVEVTVYHIQTELESYLPHAYITSTAPFHIQIKAYFFCISDAYIRNEFVLICLNLLPVIPELSPFVLNIYLKIEKKIFRKKNHTSHCDLGEGIREVTHQIKRKLAVGRKIQAVANSVNNLEIKKSKYGL